MLFPPSLSQAIRSRAFLALNGELGISPADANEFLAACEADGVAVSGWEVWLVNHQWAADAYQPSPSAGEWCGGIPRRRDSLPVVMGGVGNISDIKRQIARFDIDSEIELRWRNFVRFNFSLANSD